MKKYLIIFTERFPECYEGTRQYCLKISLQKQVQNLHLLLWDFYTLDLGDLGNKLLDVVNAVFAVLVILGVVTDPTTKGITDSDQALTYTEPKK